MFQTKCLSHETGFVSSLLPRLLMVQTTIEVLIHPTSFLLSLTFMTQFTAMAVGAAPCPDTPTACSNDLVVKTLIAPPKRYCHFTD